MNTDRKQSCCNTCNGPIQKRKITVFWGGTPCSLVNMWRNLSSPPSWQRGKTRKKMRLQICWTEGYEQSNWRQRPWREWGHTAYGATWHTWEAGALAELAPFYQATTVTSMKIQAVFVFIGMAISNLTSTIRMNNQYLLSFTWILTQIPSLEVVFCTETQI